MRAAIKQTDVYSFDELDDEAKERAIEWYRNGNLDYEWWDCTFEDVKEIGKILGIQVDRIYFSGFSSQGDGACFEGSYEYAKGSVKKIKEYAPKDAELHKIALGLQQIQRLHFYQLGATVKQKGHYMHAYCTDIYVCDEWESSMINYSKSFVETEERVSELLRDFMHWIYKRLETEYDWLQSEEQVIEGIKANELEFTEDGEIYY